MEYKTIISNHVTTIFIPMKEEKGIRKHSNGRFSAYVYFDGRNYYLGTHNTLNEAERMRKTAFEKKEEGCFKKWYYNIFPKGMNMYGGIELLYNEKKKKYILQATVNNEKYTMGSFDNPDDSEPFRKIYERHKADDTFLKWHEDFKCILDCE